MQASEASSFPLPRAKKKPGGPSQGQPLASASTARPESSRVESKPRQKSDTSPLRSASAYVRLLLLRLLLLLLPKAGEGSPRACAVTPPAQVQLSSAHGVLHRRFTVVVVTESEERKDRGVYMQGMKGELIHMGGDR